MTSERHPDVRVAGLGAATPVGRTAWASAAAVRAGVSGFNHHSFMVDSEGEPMTVGECPWLASVPGVDDRVAHLLVSAVGESLSALDANRRRRPAPTLLVNLPPQRAGLPDTLEATVRRNLEQAFPDAFAEVDVMRLGHAGGFLAMQAGLERLQGDSGKVCVVAGADSYIEPDTLEWLEDTEQLHGAGPRNNAWGFIPGEGAGSLLLISAKTADRFSIRTFAALQAVGIGREEKLIRSGEVCLGLGLTGAFRGALGALPGDARVTDVYCDMNGEPYRADEFAFAVTRTRERFVAATDFVSPADCWGDVGAASAPLFVVLASIAGAKGYALGPTVLTWASSDAGERGAALLETPPGA